MNNNQVAVRVRTEPNPPQTTMAAAMIEASKPQVQTEKKS